MIRKNKKIKVLYIAGNGHSGSTLLDIILGSSPGVFSAGELTFICRDSILDELCSCGNKIKHCPLWSRIVENWIMNSPISWEDYKRLQWKYERNKSTIHTLKNMVLPSKEFESYCLATLCLFESIQSITGKSVIIDSSKSPQRIAVLRKIVCLKVIHICRNAKGVLNSAKRSYKKDVKKGYEENMPVRKTGKTLMEWVIVNALTVFFKTGVSSKKLRYRKYIQNLEELDQIDEVIKVQKQNFSTPHMLAGNALRLKKDINIDQTVGFSYKRLTKDQMRKANILDKFFFFWN